MISHARRRLDLRWLGLIALASLALAIPIGNSGFGGSPVQASSGGLDAKGGHHCWTNCASQGYYRGQYHCHRSTKKCRKSKRRHRRHGH